MEPVPVNVYTSYVSALSVYEVMVGLPVVVTVNAVLLADDVEAALPRFRYFAPVNPEPPALLTLTARSPRMR